MVMQRLGSFVQGIPKNTVTVEHIVYALFPTYLKRPADPSLIYDLVVPLFREELSVTVHSITNRKASGPDGLLLKF